MEKLGHREMNVTINVSGVVAPICWILLPESSKLSCSELLSWIFEIMITSEHKTCQNVACGCLGVADAVTKTDTESPPWFFVNWVSTENLRNRRAPLTEGCKST